MARVFFLWTGHTIKQPSVCVDKGVERYFKTTRITLPTRTHCTGFLIRFRCVYRIIFFFDFHIDMF